MSKKKHCVTMPSDFLIANAIGSGAVEVELFSMNEQECRSVNLTPADARQFAAELILAADEVENVGANP